MVACPNRGDIIWLDFEPQTGKEIMKRRPALVLSPLLYNQASGLCLVCPISSQIKGYSLEVPVAIGRKKGVIKAEQIKSLDWRVRRAKLIQKADAKTLKHTCTIVDRLIWGND